MKRKFRFSEQSEEGGRIDELKKYKESRKSQQSLDAAYDYMRDDDDFYDDEYPE